MLTPINPTVRDIDAYHGATDIDDLLSWARVMAPDGRIVTVRMRPCRQATRHGQFTDLRTYGMVAADRGPRHDLAPVVSLLVRADHLYSANMSKSVDFDNAFLLVDVGLRIVACRFERAGIGPSDSLVEIREVRPDRGATPTMMGPEMAFHISLRRPAPGSRGAQYNDDRVSRADQFLIGLMPDA